MTPDAQDGGPGCCVVVLVLLLCRGAAIPWCGGFFGRARGAVGQGRGAMARQAVERRLCWVLAAAMLAMGASASATVCRVPAASAGREPDRA